MDVLPEMRKTKTWSKDKVMPMETWFALQKRIHDNLEIFNVEQVKKAAEDLDLTTVQVRSKHSAQHVSRNGE